MLRTSRSCLERHCGIYVFVCIIRKCLMASGRHQYQPSFTGSRYASPAVGAGTFAGRPVSGTRNTRCRCTVAALDGPGRCGIESASAHESGRNSVCCFATEASWFSIGLILDLVKSKCKHTHQPWHQLPTRQETLSALTELTQLSKRALLLHEHPYTDTKDNFEGAPNDMVSTM